jgi:hypothetical protein
MDRSQWKNIAEDLITIYKKLDSVTTVMCDIETKETPTEIANKPENLPPAGVKSSRPDTAHRRWKNSLRSNYPHFYFD